MTLFGQLIVPCCSVSPNPRHCRLGWYRALRVRRMLDKIENPSHECTRKSRLRERHGRMRTGVPFRRAMYAPEALHIRHIHCQQMSFPGVTSNAPCPSCPPVGVLPSTRMMSAKDSRNFASRIAVQVVVRQVCDSVAPRDGRRWVEGGCLRRCWISCVGARSHDHPRSRELF